MASFRLVMASCLLTASVAAQSVVDLSAFSWKLSQPSGNISDIPASFPSQAHLDLYENQIIPYPQYGLGDFDHRWVCYSNWTYSATLTGLKSNESSTWLLFNGLDTFTTIDLCGSHVASTNNQFRQYYFDITDVLSSCASDPTLSINFGSAPNIADELRNAPGAEQWPFSVEITYELYGSDFGWDWGPAFAPAGPWLPGYVIQLPTPSSISVRNMLLDIYRLKQLNNLSPDQNAPWVVNASVDVIGTVPDGVSMSVSIKDMQNKTIDSTPLSDVTSSESTITGSVVVDAEAYELWWPNGLGDQILYYFTIDILDAHNKTIASTTKRSGFRTIVLNMEPITEEQLSQGISNGNNWHFEVNGHEFYAKGSNFIPPSPFWANVTEADIRSLFSSAVEGRQNMLRVWASGAYSPDFIYDLADEAGLFLWSEFEFGDSLYPVTSEFISNVAEEVDYQVRRVNHHPSLALWAGGNELENLELQLAATYDPNNTRWKDEYEELFLHTILPIVYRNTKSISYIPSSTTNGYLYLNVTNYTMIERYDLNPDGYTYGDTDHYDYDSTVAFNLSSYPVGRFANEFGYHSMPSLQTWQGSVAPEDLSFNSTTILLRNHHNPAGSPAEDNFANSTEGMGQMTIAAQLYYPTPDKTDPLANFSAWALTTQIFQANFYASQIAYYRRGSGLPERQLGSLYWQLEDIWAAPTWAGIESTGRWKYLHYIAKDIYSEIIIAPYWNYTTGDLTAYVTSDLWSQASGQASFAWYDYSGNVLSSLSTTDFTVGAINTTQVLHLNTNNLTFPLENAVLKLNVTATGSKPNRNTSTTFEHEFWFHPTWLSKAKLVDPGLEVNFNNVSGKFVVEATEGVAAWVWLDWPGVDGHFSDNGFWLGKGDTKEVSFTAGNVRVNEVTVSSLFDNTLP